MDIVCDIYLNY